MGAIKLDGSLRGSSLRGMSRRIAAPAAPDAQSNPAQTVTSQGQAATSSNGALTQLSPQKTDDPGSQAIIDANAAIDRALHRRLQQLIDRAKNTNSARSGAQGTTDGFSSGNSESLFSLPVAKVEAPVEGAAYKKGDHIYCNRPSDSTVKAVFRVQLILEFGMAQILQAFSVSYPLDRFDLMVEAGFLYQLENEQGLVYQMPIAPKLEAGVELELVKGALEMLGSLLGPEGTAVGGALGELLPFKPLFEAKAETTIEATFFWVHGIDSAAFRAIAVLIQIFNLSSSQNFAIGLLSCEGNDPDADLPVPFPGETQPQSSPSVLVSPLR